MTDRAANPRTDPPRQPAPAEFLSGEHGHVGGHLRRPGRRIGDALLDAWIAASGTGRALDRLAQRTPPRTVLVAGVYRPDSPDVEAAVAELRRSRHAVDFALGSTGGPHPGLRAETAATGLAGGKFENLAAVLADRPATDWLVVVDDDVRLPRRFLDRFLGVCERLGLALAQPAQSLASHAAWRHLRRRAGTVARTARFVEIGPVTAFARPAAEELLPFPPLRYGWGLDAHWAAEAAARGWPLGVVDATPVGHERRRAGADYDTAAATAEAQEFLAGRPFLRADEARETVAAWRRVPA